MNRPIALLPLSLLLFVHLSIIAAAQSGSSIPDNVSRAELLKVDKESFTVADIARAYGQSPGKETPSFYLLPRDSALGFVNLYADFRLKVREAMERGLHTRPEFVAEMASNREQVALGIGNYGSISGEGYLFQRRVVDPGVQNIWKQRAMEYRIGVIFTGLKNPDNPNDTVEAYRRTASMMGMLMKGEDFERIAGDSIEEVQLKAKKGNLGWVTGGMLPIEMEFAMAETPAGSIYPGIIRIPAGYALIKVFDKAPRVKVRFAHIVFEKTKTLDGTGDGESLRRAESALARIRAGEAFEDVAREMSDDKTSAEYGGDLLAWYTRSLGFETRPGKLPPLFEETVYSLKDGEISGIIEDPTVGYRIVKRLETRLPSFEEEEKALRDIYRRYFFDVERSRYIDQVLEKNGFAIDPATFEGMLRSIDTNRSAADSLWASHIPTSILSRELFRLGSQRWTLGAWIDTVRTNPRYRGLPLSRAGLTAALKGHAEYPALTNEARTLEADYPDFGRLMNEFRDGALIFEMEQAEIFGKVGYTEQEGRDFFEEHRDDYLTAPQLELTEVYVYTEKEARAIYDRAVKGEEMDDLAESHTEREGFRDKEGKWPMNDPLNSELVRLALEKNPKPKEGTLLEPFRYQGGWSVVRIDEIAQPRRKTYEEARGEIMGDYNDWREGTLRRQMIASFRKKYKVTINTKALDAALDAAK